MVQAGTDEETIRGITIIGGRAQHARQIVLWDTWLVSQRDRREFKFEVPQVRV